MAVGKKHWALSSSEHGGVFDHAINYWQCAALNIGKTSHLFLALCHPITTSLYSPAQGSEEHLPLQENSQMQ